MNIIDLAAAIAPECKTEIVGIRPGEKLHEVMVPEDDARNTVELDGSLRDPAAVRVVHAPIATRRASAAPTASATARTPTIAG